MKATALPIIMLSALYIFGCSKDEEPRNVSRLQELAVLRVQSTVIARKSGVNRVIVRSQGEVELGVDVGKADYTPKVLKYENGKPVPGQTLTITLPQPHVFNRPRLGKIERRGENRAFWTSTGTFEKEVVDQLEIKLAQEVREAAEDKELIKFAKIRAEVLARAFFKKTHPGVHVEFDWKEDNTAPKGENE